MFTLFSETFFTNNTFNIVLAILFSNGIIKLVEEITNNIISPSLDLLFNKTILSFKTSEEVTCGARPEHLRNEEIVVSELTEKGELEFHWDKIYV